MRTLTGFLTCTLLAGCAQLHQIQISDIDQTGGNITPFDLKASADGLNLSEAGSILRAASPRKTVLHEAGGTLSTAWAILTYGPKTGNVTFSRDYGDALVFSLDQVCPSGNIGMLSSIRESNHYPVVSGEILHFKGFCIDSNNIHGSKS